ncbi:MAG: hypothetical protein FWD38_08235 [Oscillospiraceae bacterium]|nr:hypothetical protein [Oscillospiraceae bacterium]
MRVDSIISINAHQKHNPHTAEYTGISTGKPSSGIAFEEYLRANIQKISTPTVTRSTENQLAGLLMGYFVPLKAAQKDDPKPEGNVS